MKLFRRLGRKNKKQAHAEHAGWDSPNKKLVMLHSPDSYAAEQFRVLKTKVLFPGSGAAPPRSLLIAGAFQGVGKSFVAENLAISIAQSIDQYVLLMDCDMRRPSIHTTFGYDDVPGISEYLKNNAPLPSLLLKTMMPKLTLLPAGSPPPNPAEIISSKKMGELIEDVENRYDDRYIIIDSPPSRIAAETDAIVQKVDAVILVVKYGETPRESIAEMTETIGKEKIVAVVVNQCNSAVNYWRTQKSYYGYSTKKR